MPGKKSPGRRSTCAEQSRRVETRQRCICIYSGIGECGQTTPGGCSAPVPTTAEEASPRCLVDVRDWRCLLPGEQIYRSGVFAETEPRNPAQPDWRGLLSRVDLRRNG